VTRADRFILGYALDLQTGTMFGDTVKKFVLWNTFRKETSRDLDEIAVYISIEAWKVSPLRVF
jgi:hypothetical protein